MQIRPGAQWTKQAGATTEHSVYVLKEPGGGEIARVWGGGVKWLAQLEGVITQHVFVHEAMAHVKSAITAMSEAPAAESVVDEAVD